MRQPDVLEEDYLQNLLDIKNANGQNLKAVLKEISVDHDIVDDGWLIARNIYQELNGDIVDFETIEFWRVHPGNAGFSLTRAGRIGEYEYTCIFHRDFFTNEPYAKCTECFRKLQPVVAVRYREQSIEMRYIKEEIFHGSEYNPTAIYGFPPALTMWYNLLLTSAQEKYMAEYYVDKKWPSAAIFVPAKKRESAVKFKDKLEEATNKDNQSRPVFRFDPESRHKPEVMRLTDTPEEMAFIDVREESRMRMSAFWGISPIFNSDVQSSGGLNNESRQLTVMSWAIETKQTAIQENYLDKIVEIHKIQDWHFEFAQIEEEDEAADLALDLQRVEYALQMNSLGFDVELDESGNPTKFTKMEQQQDPFSQMSQNYEASLIPQTNIANQLEGTQSIIGQKSLKTAGDLIWDASRKEIIDNLRKKNINLSDEEIQDLAGNISGGIAKEILDDYAMDGIESLYYENIGNSKSENDRFYNEDELREAEKEFSEKEKEKKEILKDHYDFNFEYGDWEWKIDYEFSKFVDVQRDTINVHPDYKINQDDVDNDSPRVRKGTLNYYANETTEMKPLVVDTNYNLLDGHHRLYALDDKNQKNIRIALVEQKENNIDLKAELSDSQYGRHRSSETNFKESEHPRDKDGKFSSTSKQSKKTKKLEKYLPKQDFDMDWIESRIKGKPKLDITLANAQDSVLEYGKLAFAIFALNTELQDKKNNSRRDRYFIAKKIKSYLKFKEKMVPQLESLASDLATTTLKSNGKTLQDRLDYFNQMFSKIDLNEAKIDKIIEKEDLKIKAQLTYVGGAVFCDEHLKNKGEDIEFTNEMETCNYPGCDVSFASVKSSTYNLNKLQRRKI